MFMIVHVSTYCSYPVFLLPIRGGSWQQMWSSSKWSSATAVWCFCEPTSTTAWREMNPSRLTRDLGRNNTIPPFQQSGCSGSTSPMHVFGDIHTAKLLSSVQDVWAQLLTPGIAQRPLSPTTTTTGMLAKYRTKTPRAKIQILKCSGKGSEFKW